MKERKHGIYNFQNEILFMKERKHGIIWNVLFSKGSLPIDKELETFYLWVGYLELLTFNRKKLCEMANIEWLLCTLSIVLLNYWIRVQFD